MHNASLILPSQIIPTRIIAVTSETKFKIISLNGERKELTEEFRVYVNVKSSLCPEIRSLKEKIKRGRKKICKKRECPFSLVENAGVQKQETFMHAPRTSHSGYDDAIEESATGGKAVKKGAKDEGDDVSVLHVGWE